MSTVVVMVSNRVPMLNNFLRTLVEHEQERDIFIHYQGQDAHQIEFPEGLVYELMVSPESLGCHAARVLALRELADHGYESYVNVDDDVELIEETNWQPAIDKALTPGTGFVLTNWIKHRNALPKAVSIMADEFIPQVFVYNGGGMAYGNDVADLMRGLDPVPTRYDDIWPLTAYLNGYRNYRYRGSLAIHGIMQRGGMNLYMRREPRPLLCWDWVNYRYLDGQPVGMEYSIPMDSDLKQVAKDTHKAARAERGWK